MTAETQQAIRSTARSFEAEHPLSKESNLRKGVRTMKIIAKILTVTIAIQLVVPFQCFAQQGLNEIVQAREEIAKLEQADNDPKLSAEVRALNREFLSARKRQLNATLSQRISDLRRYLTAMEQVLKPEECQAVETSLQNLSADLRGSQAQAALKLDSIVEPRANLFANDGAKSNVHPVGPAVIGGLYDFSARNVSNHRNYFAAPAAIPISLMQGGGGAGSAAKNEDFVIDTPAAEVPKPKEVENGSVVTVKGSKSFVDICTVTTKREELKPEPNPLAAFLKILIGLGPIPLGKIAAPTCPPIGAGIVVPADPEARRIEAELKALRLRVIASVAAVNGAAKKYSDLGDKVNAFTSCKAVRVNAAGQDDLDGAGKYHLDPICDSVPNFNAAKTTIRQQVERTLAEPFPVIDSVELEMTTLKKALTDGYKKQGGAAEEAWITDVSNRLDCNAATLNELRKELASLQSSREQFESFLKLLARHTTEDDYKQKLIADSNAKVGGTVTCTNYFTKQPSFDPIPFTVTYQGFSRHAVSVGILFTTLNKRQIGITPVRTGTAADGTSTSRLTFTETDKADGQIVPFSFYNYRLWGHRKFDFNGSGGVGINPNNGATQVEFFFGAAVGFQNVFVHLGGHVGRWQELGGRFNLGDTVPAVIPVPTERRYSIRPSVGVSYKLPLP